MATDPRCGALQTRLTEAFLGHRRPAQSDLEHATGCRDCGATRASLQALGAALAGPVPEPGPARVETIRTQARRELARPTAHLRPPETAPGFRRELIRILAAAVAPLPVLAVWYAWLFEYAGVFLGSFLPAAAVTAIGAAFTLGTLSWLAAIYGSIPFVAQYQARRRWREVTP